MNILFLFGHNLDVGGHFKSAQALIYELTLKGHNIHVIAQGEDQYSIKSFLDAGASFSTINLNPNRNRKIDKYINRFKINNQIRQIMDQHKIDIIHAQDAACMITGFKIASHYCKPFVLTQAGGKFVDVKPPKKLFLVVYSRELYEGYRDKLLYLYLISERINKNVYFPLKVYKNELNNLRLPQNGFNFFFAIRFHQQKTSWINTLLYFAEKINIQQKTNFIICGDGPLLNDVMQKSRNIENRKSNINFHFLGSIKDDCVMNKLINNASICIGNGRLLMEAMACQKVVIIFGENNQYELVEQSNVEIIRKYNFSGRHFNFVEYDELCQKQKIEDLITQNKLTELSCFLFKYFEKNLSVSIGAEKILTVYNDALNSNVGKRNFIFYLLWYIKRYLSLKLINLKTAIRPSKISQ